MLVNIAADVAKLSLFIACAYALLGAHARRRRPQWTEHLTKRRLAVLGVLTLAVAGIKLIEDVVAKESRPGRLADPSVGAGLRRRAGGRAEGGSAHSPASQGLGNHRRTETPGDRSVPNGLRAGA